MATFYADENFPLPAVLELRRLGHDVVTVAQSGQANRGFSDPQVLEEATRQGRILLTLNRKHFIELHKQSADHEGIVVCTMDRDFIALAGRIDDATRQAAELKGKLIRINRPS